MTFIETVAADDATGATAELYAAEEEVFGFLPNLVRAFSLRPEVYLAWKQLNGAVKGGMDLRRYELATIAAARELRSSYCTLAHGSVLMDKGFLEPDAVRAVVSDHRDAGLDETEVAVMDLAAKVARDATSVEQDDIERLRSLGLSDKDILDVVLAAAARCFFSTVLDALGAEPDAKYGQLDPAVREALTVGRAIASV
ncbi:MAG: carboxymuconolactone decarboxylase family protein [Solirubrobacteraceae bacterium]